MAAFGFKGSLVASALAAIGASVCCAGPLLLLTLGMGGAWVFNLTAVEPARPCLPAAALVFLGFAFRRLYRPQSCKSGTPCADPCTLTRQRSIFWLVALSVVALLALPLAAPLFY